MFKPIGKKTVRGKKRGSYFKHIMSFQNNSPEFIESLWEEYFKTGSTKALSDLAAAYEPLVKKIVGVFIRKKPANLEYDDLFQAGRMGLIDAISRFKTNTGASFKTYASIRIRGSIIDEINSMDWTPRSVRKNIRSVIKSIEKFYGHGGTENELLGLIAEDTEFSENNVETIISQMNRTHMVNVEPETFEFFAPSFDLTDQEFIIWFTMILSDNFTETEQLFIHLKYFQELNNKELSEILEVPNQELTNIRKRVLYKFSVLFNKENPYGEEPEGVEWNVKKNPVSYSNADSSLEKNIGLDENIIPKKGLFVKFKDTENET